MQHSGFFATVKNKLQELREVSLLNLILLLSVSLFLIVVFFVLQKFAETSDNFGEVSRANRLITATDKLETHFFQISNEIRYAALTHNTKIIDSLPDDYRRANDMIDSIRFLLTIRSLEPEVIDTLQELVDLRFTQWQDVLNNPTYDDSTLSIRQVQGNRTFGRILKITSALKSREHSMLGKYMDNTERGIKLASVLVVLITMASIALIVFAFIKINREVLNANKISALLENKVGELDRSNRQLEQFAYMASHDLHDPLLKINIFSERLAQKEKEKLSDEGQDILRRIRNLGVQMQNLIDGLLALSLNYNKVERKDVDLNVVLNQAKQNLSIKIAEAGATINAVALPVLSGYESQLEQLFQNMISNSIRYAKKDVPPVIEISAATVLGSDIPGAPIKDKKRKFYKLLFADNGIGFDNKYAEKIFVIFQRLHGKSEYGGSGIGLATCKLVAENHGGYIVANGKPDIGAEFAVYLPY